MPNIKLSDAELATRVRARTKRASAKYRERKTESGKTQTLVWLPDTIRAQLDSLVEERNESLSAVTTELLSAALTTTTPNQTTTTPDTATRASNDSTVDLFGDSKPVDLSAPRAEPSPTLTKAERDERDRAIVELHSRIGNNHEVGRQLSCSEATVRRALKKNASQTESTI